MKRHLEPPLRNRLTSRGLSDLLPTAACRVSALRAHLGRRLGRDNLEILADLIREAAVIVELSSRVGPAKFLGEL